MASVSASDLVRRLVEHRTVRPGAYPKKGKSPASLPYNKPPCRKKNIPDVLEHFGPLIPKIGGFLGEAGELGKGVTGALAGGAEVLPYVGAVAGGLKSAVNIGMAVDQFSEGGAHNDQAWNSVGGAVNGALGAGLG